MIKNVIFDWDGTIADNTEVNYEIAMRVFKEFGAQRISLDDFRMKMRSPFMEFYNEFIPNLSFEDELKSFKKEAKKLGEEKLYKKIYPNAVNTLENLYKNGLTMVILSSGLKTAIIKGLEHHSIQKYFTDIQAEVADKVLAIKNIMQRNEFKQEETAIMGDMDSDIKAGKSAGITTIGVTYGVYSAKRIEELSPDHLIHDFKELETIINNQKQ